MTTPLINDFRWITKDPSAYSGLILPISYVFGQQSGLFHARTDDLSVSTYTEAGNRTSFVGHHRRLVGPGPTRPALGYATGGVNEVITINCLT